MSHQLDLIMMVQRLYLDRYDKTIRVWNVDTGECILTLKGHTGCVNSVGFNHDGTKIVSGSDDKTIRVWNVDTGECILTLKGHTLKQRKVSYNTCMEC